ncbi:MAG: ABC transporter ATP-binding protein [Clostridium sp.]|nr:ABC transporter ATP-binding protein [Clostridium sp.]
MSDKKEVDFKIVFGRLLRYMNPYKKGLYASVILIALASMFNSLAPFILGKATDAMTKLIIDNTVSNSGIRSFITILIILSIVYILYAVFKYLGIYIMVKVSQRTVFDLRNKVDEKLKKLPLNYFDTNTYGDILSRITNDIDIVSNSIQQSIDQIITAFTSLIFIFIMMIVISPILTLIGVITVPVALIISMKIAKSAQKYFIQQQNTLGEINGYVEEMYTGHNVISAFGKEEDVIDSFKNTNHELYSSGWKSQFLTSTLMPLTQAMTNLGYVGVAVASGILVINGKMSIGMIQSFIQYLRQFSQPINQTVQISNVLQSTAAAGSRIFEFLDEKEEIPESESPKYPDEIKGGVEFEHVKFGYLPYKYLMQDVNLKVNPGSKVAIVGPTGAGKTTLINLLLRFYDVNHGNIKIDGVDIKEMKRTKLREIFGMVLQDAWLFEGTIKENIRYGRLTATDEEVIEAAKAAHIDGFIKTLPGGYNMILQEGATNIAQGQRQLITIARAILSDAPIMILDEATSSVDTRTEVLIQKAMGNLMKGRTSFVIAHRLSTIKDADMIIYMQDGDIKETGTHEELIDRQGLYYKLYNSQFAENNKE